VPAVADADRAAVLELEWSGDGTGERIVHG
jgi:hypothetical protein